MNCRLKVTLLSVDHHPHILLLGVLEDGVEPVDHVPELLLLQGRERSVIVSSNKWLHSSSLQVGDLEGVSQALGTVNQAGPVEQMNQTEILKWMKD